MAESRIPELTGTSKKAANAWLKELHTRGLLFCLDNNPAELIQISDGTRTFTADEAQEVSGLVTHLFEKRDDELYELAYETLSKTFHIRAERRAFKAIYG
jgi:hypothetical protein